MTTDSTINPATLHKLTKATWKRLALLDDPEDVEALREILVNILEQLDALEDATQD